MGWSQEDPRLSSTEKQDVFADSTSAVGEGKDEWYDKMTVLPQLKFAIISCTAMTHDLRVGQVLACHAPASEMSALGTRGIISLHSVGWTAAGEAVMTAEPSGEQPLLVATEQGVGWLLRAYVRHTMALVYAELPCDPRSAFRLISNGALGDGWRLLPPAFHLASVGEIETKLTVEDEAVYRSLQRSVASIERMMKGYLNTDARKCLLAVSVQEMMTELATLVGCHVTCRHVEGGRLACYVPRMAELFAFLWLCVAQTVSPERQLWYAVERVAEINETAETAEMAEMAEMVEMVEMAGMPAKEGRLALRMGFVCPMDADDSTHPAEEVMRCLTFCQEMMERNEGMFLWSVGDVCRMAMDRRTAKYRPLTLSLLFLSDPVQEPWSDFKHPSLWPLDIRTYNPYGI